MSYKDKLAKCPYYIEGHSEKNTIKCECVIAERCKLKFATRNKMEKYYNKYCCNEYRVCELAKINEKFYASVLT